MVLKLSDPNLPSSQGRYAGEEGVNPSSALPLAWSTTRAHGAFQISTGLSAQWKDTVMEHWVLKFFLSFDMPMLCWVLVRWQAGQGKKLVILALYAL